jgi:hypothetical protein
LLLTGSMLLGSVGLTAVVVGAFGAAPPASAAAMCPAVNLATGCGFVIDITNSGATVTAEGGGSLDVEGDDQLIGIQNDSSQPVNEVLLSSSLDAFGFDGDGICTYTFSGGNYCSLPGHVATSPADTYGPDYEGPQNTFSNIGAGAKSALVDFTTPLAPGGGSTYFSLEAFDSASTATVVAAPTATISAPATGGTYDQGQVVDTTFSCSEGAGGPGLSSCDDNNGKNTVSGGSGTLNTSAVGGPFTYTVTATSSDALSGSAMISYSVVPALTILTTSVPAASEGVSYSTPLSAADGTGADTWSQPGGGLPTGMSLSPGGVLSGTPTGCSAIVGQCPYTFTVQVTDSANYSVQQTLTLVLTNEGSGGGPPPPPPTPPASTTVGCAGGASCSGTVGTSADVYQLSGTPTGPGSLSLSTETATLDCGNGYDQTGTILDETSKGPFPYVTVVETIYNVSGASAYRVCYEDTTPFRDLAGATVTIGLLPHCSAKIAPPCVVSQRNVDGNVVVSSNLPVGDPKVHAEKKTHPKVHTNG